MLDFIIVGGGPIGMKASIEFAKLNKSVLLIEASESLGGQLAMLYPEKEIVDIKEFASIRAIDYINELKKEMNLYPNLEVKLSSKVTNIGNDKEGVSVMINSDVFHAKHLLLTVGLGSFVPRKMDLAFQDDCENILYSLTNKEQLSGKRVLVLGGGDSALDWTKEIAKISDKVTLIHRRNEFRGDVKTIENVKNIKILTPFVPLEIIHKGNKLTELVIKSVLDNDILRLKADYVFVNFGFLPLADLFGLPNENGGLIVDEKMFVSGTNVYAIGDVARYEGKLRRIEPALKELEIILNQFR